MTRTRFLSLGYDIYIPALFWENRIVSNDRLFLDGITMDHNGDTGIGPSYQCFYRDRLHAKLDSVVTSLQ